MTSRIKDLHSSFTTTDNIKEITTSLIKERQFVEISEVPCSVITYTLQIYTIQMSFTMYRGDKQMTYYVRTPANSLKKCYSKLKTIHFISKRV